MRAIQRYPSLAILLFASTLILLVVGPQSTGDEIMMGSDVGVATAQAAPAVTVDADLGYLTVETDEVKAIWHFKTLVSEANNQSGGNLYELYYKPMDPNLERNFVSFIRRPGWGKDRGWLMPGVGGIGSTGMYATNVALPVEANNNRDDLISDNNLSGELQSYSVSRDEITNEVFLDFSYKVKSQSANTDHQATNVYWYQVDKKWTIEPDGTIKFEVTRDILSGGYFSEPAVRMNWNGEPTVGWDRYEKYGRNWNDSSNPLYHVSIAELLQENQSCFSEVNMFQSDWIELKGSQNAPSIRITADNNGTGWLGSGTYALARSVSLNSSLEQCSIRHEVTDAYGIGWFAWWGGMPPYGNRYKHLEAGTSWTDTFIIDIVPAIQNTAPIVSNVNIQSQNSNSASVSWNTDKNSDTTVKIKEPGGTWRTIEGSNTLANEHAVEVGGLTSGVAYKYQLVSKDAQGNAGYKIASGLTTGTGSAPSLGLSVEDTYWNSYSDYIDKNLTAVLGIRNQGSEPVTEIMINQATATDGVVIMTPVPIAFGAINAGELSQKQINFSIPYGVGIFRTKYIGSGIGPDGNTFIFPSA